MSVFESGQLNNEALAEIANGVDIEDGEEEKKLDGAEPVTAQQEFRQKKTGLTTGVHNYEKNSYWNQLKFYIRKKMARYPIVS